MPELFQEYLSDQISLGWLIPLLSIVFLIIYLDKFIKAVQGLGRNVLAAWKWVKKYITDLNSKYESSQDTKPVEKSSKVKRQIVSRKNFIESGSNSDGEWYRYNNGQQTCRGSITLDPTKFEFEKAKPFPKGFRTKPSIELSGDIGRVVSKEATETFIQISIDPEARTYDKKVTFEYQAHGQW